MFKRALYRSKDPVIPRIVTSGCRWCHFVSSHNLSVAIWGFVSLLWEMDWQYWAVETFEDRPAGFLDGGHFWLREFVTGGVFAVRMDASGLLTMFGPTGEFEPDGPWPYRRAITAVRTHLDRDRLRNAVASVDAYTFYVLAPLSMGLDYEWESMPPVFGLEIWDGTADAVTPVDVTERVFDEIGLWSIPTVEREVHARDLSTGTDSIPPSSLGSATAAGIVLRKKRGAAVSIRRSEFEAVSRVPPEPAGTPSQLASWLEKTLTPDSVEGLLGDRERSLESWALEELAEAVAAEVARRHFDTVGQVALSKPDQFHSAVTDRLVSLRRGPGETS